MKYTHATPLTSYTRSWTVEVMPVFLILLVFIGCGESLSDSTGREAVPDEVDAELQLDHSELSTINLVDPYVELAAIQEEASRFASGQQFDEAKQKIMEAIDLAELLEDPSELARVRYEGAILLSEGGAFADACLLLRQALADDRVENANRMLLLESLSDTLLDQGRNLDSLKVRTELLPLVQTEGDIESLTILQVQLANLATPGSGNQGSDLETAGNFLDAALKNIEQVSPAVAELVFDNAIRFATDHVPSLVAELQERQFQTLGTMAPARQPEQRSVEIQAMLDALAEIEGSYSEASREVERLYAVHAQARNFGARNAGMLAAQGVPILGGEFQNFDIEQQLQTAMSNRDQILEVLTATEREFERIVGQPAHHFRNQ